jgi:hypothetical protein
LVLEESPVDAVPILRRILKENHVIAMVGLFVIG